MHNDTKTKLAETLTVRQILSNQGIDLETAGE